MVMVSLPGVEGTERIVGSESIGVHVTLTQHVPNRRFEAQEQDLAPSWQRGTVLSPKVLHANLCST